MAHTQISGAQCEFPEILGAYEAVYRWAHEHGRQPAGPPREIYLDGASKELRMEIAEMPRPVKPMDAQMASLSG